MRIDLIFYACFWLVVSMAVLAPVYVVSWAAMKKLSPCVECHDSNMQCSKCNNLGFVWPWRNQCE
jgi:hypothetical protein